MVSLLNLTTADPKLFDDIQLPEGIDRDTLVNQILFEGCQLFPIYQDPALMRSMVNHYFAMRYQIHEELFKTLAYDYAPLENYDRQESRSTSGTNNGSRSVTGNNGLSRSLSGTDKEVTDGTITDEGGSEGSTENQVSAYNEDDYQPQSKAISEATQDNERSIDTTVTTTKGENVIENGTRSESITDTGGHSENVISRIHGNIGVTTSQQMLQAQRDVVMFSLYEFIASHFLRHFMIGIF